VNQEFLLAVLRHAPEVMRKKRPNILVNMVGFFNTTPYLRKWRRRTRSFFCEKWNKTKTPVVLQPSYSHYLPEAEFFLRIWNVV